MTLETMGFAFATDGFRDQVIEQCKVIEKAIRHRMIGHDYGAGVKNVAIGVMLIDGGSVRRLKYRPGKYEIRERANSFWFEDTLEFGIIPQFEDTSNAYSIEGVAKALRKGLQMFRPKLLRRKIPNFEAARFLSDFNEVLVTVEAQASSIGFASDSTG